MKHLIAFCLLLYPAIIFAQPRYSPEVRAKREVQWLTDSLHIGTVQGEKAYSISLEYNQQMDKASHLEGKAKAKAQKQLMNKKDKSFRQLLTREQYRKYYKREELIRAIEKRKTKGPHQPM